MTKVIFKGTAYEREQGDNFNITIEADLRGIKKDRFGVKAHLVHRDTDRQEIICGVANNIEFENISLSNLSKYLVLTIYDEKEDLKRLLVKMDLIIPEEREDTIFNELINSKLKFFQYLQFILNPDQYTDSLEIGQNKPSIGKTENETLQNILGANTSIYESLMLAASRSPRKLNEIDGIITRLQKLNSEVVSDFLPIWTVFKEFAHA